VFLQEVDRSTTCATPGEGAGDRPPKHHYPSTEDDRPQRQPTIYDLVGIRVLVAIRCYAVLGTVHARWNLIGRRLHRDAKFNMYQSRKSVTGPEGKTAPDQTWGCTGGRSTVWRRTGVGEETVPRGRAAGARRREMARLRQPVDWQ
jgi:hypothetical protein